MTKKDILASYLSHINNTGLLSNIFLETSFEKNFVPYCKAEKVLKMAHDKFSHHNS